MISFEVDVESDAKASAENEGYEFPDTLKVLLKLSLGQRAGRLAPVDITEQLHVGWV